MTTSLNFFKQYHSTVIKALGEDAKKVNAKVGSLMADKWADNVGKINLGIVSPPGTFLAFFSQAGFQICSLTFSKMPLLLDFSPLISANSRRSCFCLSFNLVGTSTLIFTSWSPFPDI